MNPASQYSGHKVLSHSSARVIAVRLSFTLPIMLVGVVISALSVIYAANQGRNLSADLQRAVSEKNQLHVEWEQLLLEKSTLTTQARVQQFATTRLDMATPDLQSVVDLEG